MNAPDAAAALAEPTNATAEITRGAGRLLSDLGYDWLREVRLATGRLNLTQDDSLAETRKL